MSTRAYSEINLHFVWHVNGNRPIISEAIEPRLHRYIRSYALQAKGLIFQEIGGTETHIHIAVTIPPTLLISEWIGKLKGASSHYVSHELANRKLLDWQTGYGVVSFGSKDLEWVPEPVWTAVSCRNRNSKVPVGKRTYHPAIPTRNNTTQGVESKPGRWSIPGFEREKWPSYSLRLKYRNGSPIYNEK